MKQRTAVAVVGTFDSKGEEHLFLKHGIERRGHPTVTVNLGIKQASPFPADFDLYETVVQSASGGGADRDQALRAVLARARVLITELHAAGTIGAVIAAGGGTGTHLATGIMRALPLGVPKVMVSTVAARDMRSIVGTKDITMLHSVADLLGVNSVSGDILDKAAGAVCGMLESGWRPEAERPRVALTMFGFVTAGAEEVKRRLERMGYEVVAFHANGTGGMAMEEMAGKGFFQGILDFATHELADELKQGYCSGIGPARLMPPKELKVPRLVVPGGLDCAVLEFTRENIPAEYRNRSIFFYDFRSAVRLSLEETRILAAQLAAKLNRDPSNVQVLVPLLGWSEADREDGPLYDPAVGNAFVGRLTQLLDPQVKVRRADLHINAPSFARLAAEAMDRMIKEKGGMPRRRT
jgi:uncharacterized protein (UPF0261 family)